MKKINKKLIGILLILTIMLNLSSTVFANSNKYIDKENDINGIQYENSNMLSLGYLKQNENGSVNITEEYVEYVKSKLKENNINASVIANNNSITIIENTNTMLRSSTSGGVTKIEWLSFNRFKIYLDNSICRTISTGGSIVGPLAFLIPDPSISKVVGAAASVAAALITANNEGNGVIISGIYVTFPAPLATFYWIKPQ